MTEVLGIWSLRPGDAIPRIFPRSASQSRHGSAQDFIPRLKRHGFSARFL
jgi:hypothetical protein